MACIKNCKLCDKLILSAAVEFNPQAERIIVNLPANTFRNKQKYCIVLAQNIPSSTTVNSQVFFTIGTETTQYQFVDSDCTPIYATQIRSRRVYPVIVNTNIDNGVFRYVGGCLPSANRAVSNSLPV